MYESSKCALCWQARRLAGLPSRLPACQLASLLAIQSAFRICHSAFVRYLCTLVLSYALSFLSVQRNDLVARNPQMKQPLHPGLRIFLTGE